MRLPTPRKLKSEYPLGDEPARFIASSRQTIRDILLGKDPRIAIIAGPCSVHNMASALEYGKRLKELSEQISSSCFIVMRVFTEKPRTTTGWKGLLYDPFLDGSNDIATGLHWTRELLRELAYLEVPAASEFLDPLTAPFLDDLVSWGFIGARTCASQVHRQLASLLPMPVGFKNSVDGNVDQAVQGAVAASMPHTFLHMSEDGVLSVAQSEGNPSAHIALRGAYDAPNYDAASVSDAATKLHASGLKTRLVIDCSHGNSQKQYLRQKEVCGAVLEQMMQRKDSPIAGIMLESHIEAGSQFFAEDPAQLKSTLSLTDPCLDWAATEELVLACAKTLAQYAERVAKLSAAIKSPF